MKKGFTLIEMIATIAIIGVLAALVIPSVSSYVSEAKVANAKRTAALVEDAMGRFNVLADEIEKGLVITAFQTGIAVDEDSADAGVVGELSGKFDDIFEGQSEVLSNSTDAAGTAVAVKISYNGSDTTDYADFWDNYQVDISDEMETLKASL